MKTVKFIKDHQSGLKEGTERTLRDVHAERLRKDGFVEIVGEATPDPKEKEFIPYKVTKADVKAGHVGTIELAKSVKIGDEIEVPNPNFKALE